MKRGRQGQAGEGATRIVHQRIGHSTDDGFALDSTSSLPKVVGPGQVVTNEIDVLRYYSFINMAASVFVWLTIDGSLFAEGTGRTHAMDGCSQV